MRTYVWDFLKSTENGTISHEAVLRFEAECLGDGVIVGQEQDVTLALLNNDHFVFENLDDIERLELISNSSSKNGYLWRLHISGLSPSPYLTNGIDPLPVEVETKVEELFVDEAAKKGHIFLRQDEDVAEIILQGGTVTFKLNGREYDLELCDAWWGLLAHADFQGIEASSWYAAVDLFNAYTIDLLHDFEQQQDGKKIKFFTIHLQECESQWEGEIGKLNQWPQSVWGQTTGEMLDLMPIKNWLQKSPYLDRLSSFTLRVHSTTAATNNVLDSAEFIKDDFDIISLQIQAGEVSLMLNVIDLHQDVFMAPDEYTTMAHEMAHIAIFHNRNTGYWGMTHFDYLQNKNGPLSERFVTHYASISYNEWLAESMVAYEQKTPLVSEYVCMSRARLAKVDPVAYEMFKKFNPYDTKEHPPENVVMDYYHNLVNRLNPTAHLDR